MNRFLMGFDDDAALILLLDELGDVVLDQFRDVVHVPASLKFHFQVMEGNSNLEETSGSQPW